MFCQTMPIAFLKNNICVPTEVKISITRNQSCTASFHTENSSLHVVVFRLKVCIFYRLECFWISSELNNSSRQFSRSNKTFGNLCRSHAIEAEEIPDPNLTFIVGFQQTHSSSKILPPSYSGSWHLE